VREVFGPLGYSVRGVRVDGVLHLKCVCSPLGENRVLVAQGSLPWDLFDDIDVVIAPASESYAANCVAIGDAAICAAGYPETHRAIEAAGLRVPPTVVCQHADAALEAFTALGGDVVVKPLFGSEGRGMVRVSDPDLAWRTFRTLERTQAVLYVQQYVAHPGWDLRVFVLGGRVLTAMRRRANGGWRTNVAQGGTAEVTRVGPVETELALRAAAAVGAAVAGVDLLPGPGGVWYVIEVNAVPGWRALAPVTGVDVAAELLRFFADDYRGNGQ